MTHRVFGRCIALLMFLFAAAAVGTAPALADHPATATPAELRELRTEVNRLDDALRTVRDDHPRAQEFRDREKEIREDLAWLRDQMLQHQQDESKGAGASRSEVESLRREIRSLRDDIDRAVAPVAQSARDIDVPDGTQIQLRLEEPISSKTARPEDRVVATVVDPVYVEGESGRPAIPAGAEVRGTVENVEPAERPSKGGRLDMSFDSLVVGDQTVRMDTRVVEMKEGGIDERRAGLGALIGGVLGAVLDGKKGAILGAIVGGGGAIVASSGQDVELPAGTLVTVRLERPLRAALR